MGGKEARRQGDKETRRQGGISLLSPHPPLSPSPHLPISPTPPPPTCFNACTYLGDGVHDHDRGHSLVGLGS